jgi:uncharacterized cupredoxin-like copper-binding protein
MPRLKAVLTSTAVGAAAACAAAGAWSSAQAQSKPTASVDVKLTNFKIAPSRKSVKAGRITFVATDDSAAGHELVVIKTKLEAAKLPVRNAVADQKGAVAELSDVQPDQTQRLTVRLKPGHYALICNVTGHYAAGMHTDFTVR